MENRKQNDKGEYIMSILNEMKELLSMIGKEFGMKYMFNPDGRIEDEVLALRHPTNDNFIHIEKDGECFEIAIFLNKDKFMLVSTVKDKNGCINFIKKYGYLLEALNMSFSTNDGKIVDCLCIDVQECDCK